MLMKTTVRCMNFISKRVELNEDEEQIIAYRIKMIISDALMLVLMCSFFTLLGLGMEFCVSYLVMRLSRTRIGGIHRKTKWGCSIHTFVFFLLACLLADLVPNESVVLWFAFFIAVDMAFAPCPSKERGQFGKKARMRMKILACIGLAICLSFCLMFPVYGNTVIVTLQMVHIEFLLKSFIERRCLRQ